MATLTIDLPDSLYAALSARAEAHHRPVAEEATHLLAEALGQLPLSILNLQGLGKEIWAGIDAARHVDDERASWDPRG